MHVAVFCVHNEYAWITSYVTMCYAYDGHIRAFALHAIHCEPMVRAHSIISYTISRDVWHDDVVSAIISASFRLWQQTISSAAVIPNYLSVFLLYLLLF